MRMSYIGDIVINGNQNLIFLSILSWSLRILRDKLGTPFVTFLFDGMTVKPKDDQIVQQTCERFFQHGHGIVVAA